MARKRMVDPKFYKHAELYDAEVASQLPLMLGFSGLWGQADRRGIFEWKPRELKLEVLPYHPVDFAGVLDALESAGFIQSYTVKGRKYGVIPSFGRWQTFHHNEKPSDAPNPPADIPAPTPPAPSAPPAAPKPTNGDHTPAIGEAATDNGERSPTVIGYRLSGTAPIAVAGTADGADTGQPPQLPVRTAVPPAAYALQERQLRDACEPHVALALTALMTRHSQPYTIVFELYAMATGLHVQYGDQTGTRVTIEHVMAAIWEMAVNDARWNVSLFRGYCRRCADRPDHGATPEARTLRKVAAEAAKFSAPALATGEVGTDGVIVSRPLVLEPDTPEAIEQRRQNTRAAMEKLRGEWRKNSGEPNADGAAA